MIHERQRRYAAQLTVAPGRGAAEVVRFIGCRCAAPVNLAFGDLRVLSREAWLMRTMFDAATHAEVLDRIRRLRPDAQRRFGRMTAPQMVAHLTDQMRHTLGDATARAQPGLRRLRVVRHAVIYWLPWPKGRVKGPPEAFVTQPTDWDVDVATLIDLVNRFVARGPGGAWPEHALFGPLTGKDWGVFCHKHFNHHLSQFGV